jgi:hypothetical protein
VIVYTCATQTVQFISDSGGVLGLWFGVAVFTLIELIEVIVDSIVLGLRKLITRQCR